MTTSNPTPEPDAGGTDALPGDAAPPFSASASTGAELSLDAFVGKVPVALTFTGTLPPAATDDVVDAFATLLSEFGGQRVQSLLVLPEPDERLKERRRTGTNVPLLADEDGRLVELYATSATFPITVLIDETGTVVRLLEGGEPAGHAAAVLAAATETAHSTPPA